MSRLPSQPTIRSAYADQRGPGGQRIATQLAKQLAEPSPYDLDTVDLHCYRQLAPRWRDWSAVTAACLDLATRTPAASEGQP